MNGRPGIKAVSFDRLATGERDKFVDGFSPYGSSADRGGGCGKHGRIKNADVRAACEFHFSFAAGGETRFGLSPQQDADDRPPPDLFDIFPARHSRKGVTIEQEEKCVAGIAPCHFSHHIASKGALACSAPDRLRPHLQRPQPADLSSRAGGIEKDM